MYPPYMAVVETKRVNTCKALIIGPGSGQHKLYVSYFYFYIVVLMMLSVVSILCRQIIGLLSVILIDMIIHLNRIFQERNKPLIKSLIACKRVHVNKRIQQNK